MTTEKSYMIPSSTSTVMPLNMASAATPSLISAPKPTLPAIIAAERRTKRPRKDPNAPRHFTSAFQLFWKEKVDHLNELHKTKPLSLMDRNLIVKKLYDNLSPEEKQRYRELANQDRARYLTEMDAYKSTPEYAQYLESISHVFAGPHSLASIKKRKRDPNRSQPKVLTSFFLFCNEMRSSVQPESSPGESKLLAQTRALTDMWRAMDETGKQKYRQMYQKQREELAVYNATHRNENMMDPNVALNQRQVPASSQEFDLVLHDGHDDDEEAEEEAEEDECVEDQLEY